MGDTYSLMRGGLVHRVFLKFSGAPARNLPAWILMALLVVCVLPISVAALSSGTLCGKSSVVPLCRDYSTIARFLIAVPLLVMAATYCDNLMRQTLWNLPRSGLIAQGQFNEYGRILAGIRRLRDSVIPELMLVAVAFAPALTAHPAMDPLQGVESWRLDASGAATRAGRWYALVAVPMFRFVLLVWLWRFVLWCLLLWRLSRLDLLLDAAHPDGSGGLLLLGEAQARFVVITVAGSILVAGNCMNNIEHLGQSLYQQKYLLLGYLVCSVLFLVAPLLLVGRRLFSVKRKALLAHSALAHATVRQFRERWIGRSRPEGSLLDAAAPSALADYGAIYQTVRHMSVFPITRNTLLWLVFAAALPLSSPVIMAMPLEELEKTLLSIIA